MKITKSLVMQLFAAAALLVLAPSSRALTTDYMVGLSNQLSGYRDALAPSPDEEHQKMVRTFNRALKDLSKPTTSVAQDYDRFFLAVVHLGKYAFTDSLLVEAGATISSNFIYDASVKIGELSFRTNGLNDFVPTRKAAMKNIDQAYALLIANLSETNQQTALVRGRQIFKKLVTAEKLVVKGEGRLGFAPQPGAISGAVLNYQERAKSGAITFTDSTNYEQRLVSETVAGNYTYTRTGLNTAVIVLSQLGGRVTTVKVNFTTTTSGKFTFKFVNGADTGSAAGTFTLSFPG